MRHFKQMLLIAAMLLGINAWAEDASSRLSIKYLIDTNEVESTDPMPGTVNVSVTVNNGISTATVTVTPNDAYYFTNDDLTVELITDAGNAQSRRRAASNGPGFAEAPDVAPGQNNTLTGTSTFTFDLDDDENITYLVTANFHTPILLTGATVTIDQNSFVYDGSEAKPTVTQVTLNGATLTADDYSVDYANNVNAASSTSTSKPTVIVTGLGKYTGNASTTFTITKRPVTFTGKTDSKTYTGSEIELTGLTVSSGEDEGLVTGHTHNVTYSAKGTNVNTYTGTITAKDDVVIKSGDTPVTGNYDITIVNGTLTINKKSVTVTAKSEAFTYDGTAHSNAGYDVEGLVGSDAISAVVEGSITFPSESPVTNKLKSYSFTTGTAGNYSVTTKDGELTMTNASVAITITAASAEWTYDGNAHSNTAVTVTSGALFTGDQLEAEATGSVTDVADTKTGNNPVKAGYKVMHGTEDVTANYVITAVAGTLKITSAPMTVSAEGWSGTYDTQKHSITVSAPADATIKYGTKKDTYDLTANPEYEKAGEYEVFYQVTRKNFAPIKGSAKVEISKAEGSVSFDEATIQKSFSTGQYVKKAKVVGYVAATYSSSDLSVAEVNEKTGEVKLKKTGHAVITATLADDGNHVFSTTSASYDLTVTLGSMYVTSKDYEGIYDGREHTAKLYNIPEGATVVFGTDPRSDDFSINEMPKYKDAAMYVFYYMVTKENYKPVSGKCKVVISPATITSMTLASNSLEYTGSEQTMEVTSVMAGHMTLSDNDYTVEGNVQTEPGEYTVIVKGHKNFTGELSATFVIEGSPVYTKYMALLGQLKKESDGIAGVIGKKKLTDAAKTELLKDWNAINVQVEALKKQLEEDMANDDCNQNESDYKAQLEKIGADISALTTRVQNFHVMGDANGDDEADIDDYVIVGQMILGQRPMPTGDLLLALDLNGNGSIGVGDLTGVVNLWMGRNWNDSGTEARTMENANEWLSMSTDGTGRIDIVLKNQREYATFVMDVVLPEGMVLRGARMSERGSESHELRMVTWEDGTVRLLASSMQNDVFGGTDGVLVSLDVTTTAAYKGGNVEVRNAIFATPETTEHAIGMTGSTTGVDAIDHGQWTIDNEVYGLDGRRHEVMKPGVNIMRRADGSTVKVIRR